MQNVFHLGSSSQGFYKASVHHPLCSQLQDKSPLPSTSKFERLTFQWWGGGRSLSLRVSLKHFNPTWFLHVLWLKRVVSSIMGSYRQVLEGNQWKAMAVVSNIYRAFCNLWLWRREGESVFFRDAVPRGSLYSSRMSNICSSITALNRLHGFFLERVQEVGNSWWL